jgi:hypothetical protein
MNQCLFCYLPLAGNELDFHGRCSQKIFGQPTPPSLPYSEADLEKKFDWCKKTNGCNKKDAINKFKKSRKTLKKGNKKMLKDNFYHAFDDELKVLIKLMISDNILRIVYWNEQQLPNWEPDTRLLRRVVLVISIEAISAELI